MKLLSKYTEAGKDISQAEEGASLLSRLFLAWFFDIFTILES